MDRSEAALDTIMQDINPRRRNPASLESRSSLAANARYVVGDPLFTANGMHSHDKFSDRTPREISAKRSVNGREISNVPLTDRHLKVQNESHGYKSRSPPGLLDIPQETAQEFLSYSRSNAQSDEEASSHMRSPLSARDTQSYTRRNVQSDGEANGYMRQPPSHTSQGMYGELSSMAYRESPRRRSGSWTERQFEGSPMSKRMPQRTLTVQKGQIAKFLDETRPDEFYHRATRQNPALYDAWTNWRRAESISQKLKDLKTLCDGKDLAQTRSQQSGGDHGSNKRSPVKQPQLVFVNRVGKTAVTPAGSNTSSSQSKRSTTQRGGESHQDDQTETASENQSRLLGRLTALGTSLKATQASLESRIDSRFEAITRLEAAVDAMGKSMEAVHEKLDKIGEAMGVSIEKAGDDDEDRKRIKERLKEALDVHKRQQGLDRVGYIEYLFGVCKADGRVGKFGSRLIHPQSTFMQGMLVLTASMLLYTAAIVPFQICLWNYDDPCNKFPSLYFDVFVDTFFLFEIVLGFVVGTYDKDLNYIDDWKWILQSKLTSISGFWLDCVTSIPWSWFDLQAYLLCISAADGAVQSSSTGNERIIRVVKVFRLLRIAKILKLARFVTIFKDYAVLYFGSASFKIMRLLIIALFSIHFFACTFYRVKNESAVNPDDVANFYTSRNVDPEDLGNAYLLCFYYVLTTFTTVGYGDIFASTNGERVFCIFLFFCAASLFGTIISQANEIVASQAAVSKELDSTLEAYLTVHPSPEVDTMINIWGWERFKFLINHEHTQHKAILERKLPNTLKLAIAKQIENNLFSKVPFLCGMSDLGELRTMFSAELIMKASTKYFAKGSIVADSHEAAKGLMVVTSGQLGIELPMDSEEADDESSKTNGKTLLYVLGRGECLGGGTVVGDTRWAGTYGIESDLVARSHCSLEIISCEDIQDILGKFEFFPIKCRIQQAAEMYRKSSKKLEEMRAGHTPKLKVTFFWTLLVNQILQYYSSNPKLWPETSPLIFEGSNGLNDLSGPVKMELTPKEAEQIREIFELFDTDGGGTMDKQELDAARFALGFDRNQKHKKSSKKNAAPAAPELITLEEFSSMMKGEKNGRGPYDGVWMVFSVICAQGAEEGESNDRSGSAKGKFNAENKVTSGYITFEGLRQACNQFNVRLSEDEVHEMMAEGDPSDSGKVDIDSFFRIIGSAPWF